MFTVCFGDQLHHLVIDAQWATCSWILLNIADMMPSFCAWNVQYAQHSDTLPSLEAYYFERLYTNIHADDNKSKVMELVTLVFNLPAHANQKGIEVWETQPAMWLQQHKI